MNCCSNDTLIMGRPTSGNVNATQCSSSCSDLGPQDPLNINQLTPRRNRSKVRQQVREYILHMLGAPTLKLELDEQNIDFCVDQALMIFEQYASREYFSYFSFDTIPGKSVYELPPEEVGYVRNVYYDKVAKSAIFQAADLGGVIPIEYNYAGGSASNGGMFNPTTPVWGKMGEWVLYKGYETMYARTASALGGWEWISDYNHIKLYPTPYNSRRVGVHYIQKNKDWQQVNEAMQTGALSFAKEILGRIRSRFGNPIGPSGGIQLDGATLLQEAKEEREMWKRDLIYRYGDLYGPTLD
jgi:hypothetical protein